MSQSGFRFASHECAFLSLPYPTAAFQTDTPLKPWKIFALLRKCELRSVIRFLQTEGNSAAEIQRIMSRLYGENVLSDDVVREWCRKFKEGRTDVHDADGQGRKSVATEVLVQRILGSFWSNLNGTCLITRRIARLSDE
ncbi:hypothetical protein AVEN_107283-1 [Araneus ventricosus]|uniref:Mos1 transposase HTH domain-containing protein n=1 Tax=Araneus ventricosus TaxID=182803 RepID=A0A4Y2DRX6_ARAVE|nr:hypothetical protein AVEN_107283-1 [Araneus ventricosus]